MSKNLPAAVIEGEADESNYGKSWVALNVGDHSHCVIVCMKFDNGSALRNYKQIVLRLPTSSEFA